jgi:hypothetical protein
MNPTNIRSSSPLPYPTANFTAAARRIVCVLAAILCLAPTGYGQVIVHTSRATFDAALQPGFYLETFDSAPATGEVSSPQSFMGGSSNQFSWSAATQDATSLFYATDPTDPMMSDIWLGTFESDVPINFTLAGSNISAVGAYFFLTNIVNGPAEGTISIAINGGTPVMAGPATMDGTTFIGFTDASGTPITSLTFTFTSTVPTTAYATLNDFIVGQAIPEPSSLALLGGALAFGAVRACRRKRFR